MLASWVLESRFCCRFCFRVDMENRLFGDFTDRDDWPFASTWRRHQHLAVPGLPLRYRAGRPSLRHGLDLGGAPQTCTKVLARPWQGPTPSRRKASRWEVTSGWPQVTQSRHGSRFWPEGQVEELCSRLASRRSQSMLSNPRSAIKDKTGTRWRSAI